MPIEMKTMATMAMVRMPNTSTCRSRRWRRTALRRLPCGDPASLTCALPLGCSGGGWGIRTPEGLHPTRFPSVRHKPLGEFSWRCLPLSRPAAHSILLDREGPLAHAPLTGTRYNSFRLPTWRHPGQLPQGGNAARVTRLWRVRGGSFLCPAPGHDRRVYCAQQCRAFYAL